MEGKAEAVNGQSCRRRPQQAKIGREALAFPIAADLELHYSLPIIYAIAPHNSHTSKEATSGPCCPYCSLTGRAKQTGPAGRSR